MFRPGLACANCAGWSGSIYYAESIMLVYSLNGSYNSIEYVWSETISPDHTTSLCVRHRIKGRHKFTLYIKIFFSGFSYVLPHDTEETNPRPSPHLYLVYLYGLSPLLILNDFVGDNLIGWHKGQSEMTCNSMSSDLYTREWYCSKVKVWLQNYSSLICAQNLCSSIW